MSIEELGWKIDYKRFRVYLKEHYLVEKAYMFMGFMPSEQQLYNFLQESGFILVFKPLLELKNGDVKGNCDAELVLQTMIDYSHYHKALIVTGDGDFHCLLKYLSEKQKLLTVLAPSYKNCSSLIKKVVQGNLSLVSDLKRKIVYKKSSKSARTGKILRQADKMDGSKSWPANGSAVSGQRPRTGQASRSQKIKPVSGSKQLLKHYFRRPKRPLQSPEKRPYGNINGKKKASLRRN